MCPPFKKAIRRVAPTKFMRIFEIDKTVVKLSGNIDHFFKGLTSNDLEAPFNAFLNQHGRTVATFDQLRLNANEFILLVESCMYERMFQHIEKFLALNKTRCERVIDKHVYFDLDNKIEAQDNDWIFSQKEGRIIVTDDMYSENISEDEFIQFRLQNRIPRQGKDYDDEMILNISETDFVSFTKGCFLGQEPVSKVHNRAKPTWRLDVKPEKECTEKELEKMTSRVYDDDFGCVRGFVFVKND